MRQKKRKTTILTSRSRRSGLVKNLAKKYSLKLLSSSGSLFLFNGTPLGPALLPIMALSLAVASLMTGRTLVTDSLNSTNESLLIKIGGFEKGS